VTQLAADSPAAEILSNRHAPGRTVSTTRLHVCWRTQDLPSGGRKRLPTYARLTTTQRASSRPTPLSEHVARRHLRDGHSTVSGARLGDAC
jgi:hypothetical protein